MKVIFIKDLKGKGRVNDIKEVSDGYAMNFLIKNGYAVAYNKANASKLNSDLKKADEKEKKDIKIAEDIKKKIEKENLSFVVKVGKEGRVFGSISSKQIADRLNELGYDIDKKNINIDGSLNTLGVHNVNVMLHKKVEAIVKVSLIEK